MGRFAGKRLARTSARKPTGDLTRSQITLDPLLAQPGEQPVELIISGPWYTPIRFAAARIMFFIPTYNVVYGKATGSFPSGHAKGMPFSPGANPENGMDTHGMVASMLSVGKLDYNDALDGISLTNTITPQGLGRISDRNPTAPAIRHRRENLHLRIP